VVDLWFLALGFGLLPIAALVLVAAPALVRTRATIVWGLLIGVVAFLGLAHAGTAILEGNAYLRYEATPEISAATAAGGLLLGTGLGWVVLGRRGASGSALGSVAGAAAIYVALHSVADGLVLGEAYAGPLATGYSLTVVLVGGTILHRFAEGALIVVPALLGTSKRPRWLPLLLVGLLTFPAAYVPVAILGGSPSSASYALDQGVSVFVAGVEAGFAGLLLFLGLLPRVADAKDRRWAVAAGLAFTAMLLIHFLVE
jgi:hypothetical protein